MTNDQNGAALCFSEYDLPIRGQDIDGATYFFLPSFIRLNEINYDASDIRIFSENGTLLDKPAVNTAQNVLIDVGNGDRIPWRVGFYQSENLHTMDIRLSGITAEDIKKGELTDASMNMYAPDGDKTFYSDSIRIKGRGNSTWIIDKKPYEIRLPEEAALAGLTKSDNWTLLANANDPTKMKNRIAFDLSHILGMEYATESESEWIDLYIDGDYMGNYQICHEPGIGHERLDITNLEKKNKKYFEGAHEYKDETEKGYIYANEVEGDITGGYLLEYTQDDLYDEKKCGFLTGPNEYFVIKSPNNASKEEVEYISGISKNVDRELHENMGSAQYKMIDRASFAKRFLVDEITMNKDAAFVSHYFYKKQGEDKLYAGPCWDYDKSCGYGTGKYKDYTGTVILPKLNPLDWNSVLYKNGDFRSYVWEVFGERAGAIDRLINRTIDGYYDKISASVEMDRIRWQNIDVDQYEKLYDDVRYLKFFLYKRVQYLADANDTGVRFTEPDIYQNMQHKLIYNMDDGSQRVETVEDGAQAETDDGWGFAKFPECDTSYIPVFEDMEVINKEAEE